MQTMNLNLSLYTCIKNYVEYKLTYRSDDTEIVRLLDRDGKCIEKDGFTEGNMPHEAIELARLYLKSEDIL